MSADQWHCCQCDGCCKPLEAGLAVVLQGKPYHADCAAHWAERTPNRIVIAGGPRTGKTTLGKHMSAQLGYPLLSTDVYLHLPWSDASDLVAERMLRTGPWIIEGVTVPRALRKAWAGSGRLVDKAIWLGEPYGALSAAQERLSKGCLTVWRECLPWLLQSGTEVETRGC